MTILHGDARVVGNPTQCDPATTVILTDPPWPNMPEGIYPGMSESPDYVFASVMRRWADTARTIIVVLGDACDPRMLNHIPTSHPFRCARWLRKAIPNYLGCTLSAADVAYVFGRNERPVDATVAPGECSTSQQFRRDDHPTPRSPAHMRWLIRWFTQPGDLVIDPFCGSGSTIEAALDLGRRGLGIEQNAEYAAAARKRLEARSQLF